MEIQTLDGASLHTVWFQESPHSGLGTDMKAACSLSVQCYYWAILGVTGGSVRSLGGHRCQKVIIEQCKGGGLLNWALDGQ